MLVLESLCTNLQPANSISSSENIAPGTFTADFLWRSVTEMTTALMINNLTGPWQTCIRLCWEKFVCTVDVFVFKTSLCIVCCLNNIVTALLYTQVLNSFELESVSSWFIVIFLLICFLPSPTCMCWAGSLQQVERSRIREDNKSVLTHLLISHYPFWTTVCPKSVCSRSNTVI